jgi:exodeoxyribonuclease VII large subunit
LNQLETLKKNLFSYMVSHIRHEHTELLNVSRRLIDPKKKIEDLRLRCDDLTDQLIRGFNDFIRRQREQMMWRIEMLYRTSPKARMNGFIEHVCHMEKRLKNEISNIISQKKHKYNLLTASLRTLSPIAVLDRGYSITRTIPQKKVVKSNEQVVCGSSLEILLAKGSLEVSVNKKLNSNRENRNVE